MANKLNQQLNALRNEIRPDSAWQERSREILLMQVKQGVVEKEAQWFTFIETVWMQKFLIQATRPLALATMIILAVFGGSVMSIRAANQTKPGDPLYIAKIISEKAHFALTFDNAQKAKLNLTFAANRATELKEMQQANPEVADHAEKIKELTNEINTELAEAKTRIAKIEPAVRNKEKTDDKPAADDAKKAVAVATKTDSNAAKVAPAVIEKDKDGIDFYDPRQAALEQAKNYIESKDYNAAASQLMNLTEAIDQPEKLEVKGTSTVEKKADVKSEKLEKGTSTDLGTSNK
jgi:hypothetical protein